MPTLSVIVPVYNEAKHLGELIPYLLDSRCSIKREWIFVDDCSSDDSLEIMRRISRKYGYTVLSNERNCGKGSAVIRGIQEATGEFIHIQDADFEYDPNEVDSLLEPLLQNKADVVYGSRFRREGKQVHRTYHYMVNRILTMFSNFLSGIYLTDMETCYKVFRADLIKSMNLRSKRFGIEVELTAYVAKLRARIAEIPISYFPRRGIHGKKITWLDGVAALWHLLRFNWFTSRKRAFKEVPSKYLSFRSYSLSSVQKFNEI